MRVLHVTSSLRRGGAEAILVELVLGAQQRGIENHVIYFHDGPHVQTLAQAGIPLYHVTGAASVYDPLVIWRVRQLVLRIRPDVIHSLLWLANLIVRIVARQMGVPFVAALHNNIDQNGPVRTWLDRQTIQRHDRFIAVSSGVRDSLHVALPGTRDNHIDVIGNGLDGDVITQRCMQALQRRTALGLQDHHTVIGSVGRWEQVKNYLLLIETFAHLVRTHDHLKLVLIGIGSQKELLKQRVRDLALESDVLFVEGQPGYGYYPIFDCFASSSPKEGVSIALLEAMHMGVPCIVTSADGTHAVLQNGLNGIVSHTQDALAFALAFEPFLQNAGYRRQMGQAGQKMARQCYTLETMIDAYLNVYKQLVA